MHQNYGMLTSSGCDCDRASEIGSEGYDGDQDSEALIGPEGSEGSEGEQDEASGYDGDSDFEDQRDVEDGLDIGTLINIGIQAEPLGISSDVAIYAYEHIAARVQGPLLPYLEFVEAITADVLEHDADFLTDFQALEHFEILIRRFTRALAPAYLAASLEPVAGGVT